MVNIVNDKRSVVDEHSILNAFNLYFEMVPVNSEGLLIEVFKLRYQVYCIETAFENPSNYANELEQDAWDINSVHYLIRHKATGIYAATTRLILPDETDLSMQFPLEENCVIDNTTILEILPRRRLAEVSRFCVSKNFKRRKGEADTLEGIGSEGAKHYFSEDERGAFPHITLALIACLVDMSRAHGIDYWYAVMGPSLLKFLEYLGIHFSKIGPVVNYHGRRLPGVALVDNILAGTKEKNIQVWAMLTNGGRFWGN